MNRMSVRLGAAPVGNVPSRPATVLIVVVFAEPFRENAYHAEQKEIVPQRMESPQGGTPAEELSIYGGSYLMVSANSTCRWPHIKLFTLPDTTTGDRVLLMLRAQAASGAVAPTRAVWSARWIRDGHRIVWHGRR